MWLRNSLGREGMSSNHVEAFLFFVCFALFCLFVFLTGELPKCLWFGISSSVDISTQVVSGSHSSNPVENFLGFSFPYFGSSLS